MFALKRCLYLNVSRINYTGIRCILSQAYLCEEIWQKRLENPILKNIKMSQYFIDTDKKFGSKELVNGVDIDLFANNVQQESELDELEHLLYRFRRTKRAVEVMDSTAHAVIRIFLKYKQYKSLFRILEDRESYGIFPDMYSYNILMDTFLEEKLYKEAAHIAILMMLQEDFSNKISCLLALYSCQIFLNEHAPELLFSKKEIVEEKVGENEEEEEEETLVRVPFLRNPWFDDHFDLEDPKHLIGKTLYLVGREVNDILGRTYQLLGLSMYEKWDKALNILKAMSESNISPLLLSEGVEKFTEQLMAIPDSELRSKWQNEFEAIFQKCQKEDKIMSGELMTYLNSKIKEISSLESKDIESQKKIFLEWEHQRKLALDKQNQEIDKRRRLKIIEEKKEYLYWKEKLLFFFENEAKNLEELAKVEEMVAQLKAKKVTEDVYEPPEIVKKAPPKLSIYEKLARVKKL